MERKGLITVISMIVLASGLVTHSVSGAQRYQIETPHQGWFNGLVARAELRLGVRVLSVEFVSQACAGGDCGDESFPDYPGSCDDCAGSVCLYTGDYDSACMVYQAQTPGCEVCTVSGNVPCF